ADLRAMTPRTIAIDGPAGAGKSTIGALVAERLGYLFLDTGAMYRAIALAAKRQGIDPDNADRLATLAREVRVLIGPPTKRDGRAYTVLLGGDDVTWAIRDADIDRTVSQVARVPAVRSAMVEQQRALASKGRVAGAPVQPESKLWLWRLLFPPVRAVVSLFADVEVVGRENVPASGPYIIVANHINWKDPPMVSISLGTPIRWMAKIEVFDYFFIGFLLRGIGNFAVRRGESDRRSVQLALQVLDRGLPLGVFPEGHRSEDRALLRGRPGISLLADRANAPIVPCAIVGTPTAMPHI